ncbi:conserved exported hypothetical protein [Candidatus Roizmanbacteria bacterium]|nr:conserved exported hypothetical protein [Candidatus Roizmanbacteria bacterium]
MKKILIGLLLFFSLIFPVSAQFDDIQPDAVNLDAIYPTDSVAATNNVIGEHIKSFHSKIVINKDGTIDVNENIKYDFSDLSKHGIYREIPFIKTNQDGKKYKLELSNFSVTDKNGISYKYVKSLVNEKLIRLKIGDADKLITGIHNYVISYQVSGAVTYFSDHDELYWNVTGNEWEVPIAVLTSEVRIPDGIKNEDIKTACYTGVAGSKESLCKVEQSSGGESKMIIKNNDVLGNGEGLSIAVSFPKNIVAVLEPKEFVSFWDSFLGKFVMGLMGLIGVIWYVFLPFYIIYKWFKTGRDPSTNSREVSAWFDPPKTQDGKRFLTPGEVGTLGDETVDMKDISATIVDLARRGYLIIDERKKGDYYLIKNKIVDSSLLNYEKSILTKFFKNEKEIRIKDEELSSEVAQIKNEMYEQVVEDRLFDRNPQTTRTKYYVLAGITLFTSNFFLAIVAFLFGRAMPRKTVFGVEAKNVAFSLKNFLTSQKKQLEFQADKQMMFEKLLPYAVAFGVERIWAKRFENLNIIQPNWYRGYNSTNFNSYLLVNSLNSSMKSFATAATPTRSSSGFSSGFSGGFSGGGGGGGGGGSW